MNWASRTLMAAAKANLPANRRVPVLTPHKPRRYKHPDARGLIRSTREKMDNIVENALADRHQTDKINDEIETARADPDVTVDEESVNNFGWEQKYRDATNPFPSDWMRYGDYEVRRHSQHEADRISKVKMNQESLKYRGVKPPGWLHSESKRMPRSMNKKTIAKMPPINDMYMTGPYNDDDVWQQNPDRHLFHDAQHGRRIPSKRQPNLPPKELEKRRPAVRRGMKSLFGSWAANSLFAALTAVSLEKMLAPGSKYWDKPHNRGALMLPRPDEINYADPGHSKWLKTGDPDMHPGVAMVQEAMGAPSHKKKEIQKWIRAERNNRWNWDSGTDDQRRTTRMIRRERRRAAKADPTWRPSGLLVEHQKNIETRDTPFEASPEYYHGMTRKDWSPNVYDEYRRKYGREQADSIATTRRRIRGMQNLGLGEKHDKTIGKNSLVPNTYDNTVRDYTKKGYSPIDKFNKGQGWGPPPDDPPEPPARRPKGASWATRTLAGAALGAGRWDDEGAGRTGKREDQGSGSEGRWFRGPPPKPIDDDEPPAKPRPQRGPARDSDLKNVGLRNTLLYYANRDKDVDGTTLDDYDPSDLSIHFVSEGRRQGMNLMNRRSLVRRGIKPQGYQMRDSTQMPRSVADRMEHHAKFLKKRTQRRQQRQQKGRPRPRLYRGVPARFRSMFGPGSKYAARTLAAALGDHE